MALPCKSSSEAGLKISYMPQAQIEDLLCSGMAGDFSLFEGVFHVHKLVMK